MATVFVTRLDEQAGRRLYAELGSGAFAFRTVPHAHWSAHGEETTVTWYRSGKLVVQGRGTDAFVAQRLPETRGDAAKASSPTTRPELAELGSDESGKGDYYGPLVVAAALVRPDDLDELAALGVQDSKKVGDGTIRRVEGVLAEKLPHAVRVLDPPAYNVAWAEVRNLNKLLGRLHAEVIDEVLESVGDEDLRIVVDRFGDPQHVRRHLGETARGKRFVMQERAESHPAVAAASFLARAAFLRGMEELEGLAGGVLYRGASDPRIVRLGRRLLDEGGHEWLGKFAKVHFKVTQKL